MAMGTPFLAFDIFGSPVIIRARRSRVAVALVLMAVVSAMSASRARAEDSFRKEVAPILVRSCVACHGERTALGGWRTHTLKSLFAAGKSGKAPIVAGKPERSELFARITSHDPVRRMPSGDNPLPRQAIETLRRWIASGAPTEGIDPGVALASLEGPRNHPQAPARYRNPLPVTALAVSPDGTLVASGGYHEVLLWNTESGKLERRIGKLPQRIQALQWSPDGSQLLVGGGTPGEYGEVTVVESATGARRVLGTLPDLVLAVGFSPDARHVVAGGADSSARCYDTAEAKELWSHKVHADWVTGIGFTGDGRFVASSGRDKVVKVYEAASGTLFTTYNGHNRNIGRYRGQAPVWSLAFPPGQSVLYSAGGGEWLQAWEPEKAKKETGDAGDMEERFQTGSHARYMAHGLQGAVLSIAISANRIYAAGEQGVVVEIDPETREVRRRYGVPGDWVHAVSVDPQGKIVAAGRYDGTITLYSPETGAVRHSFPAVPPPPRFPTQEPRIRTKPAKQTSSLPRASR